MQKSTLDGKFGIQVFYHSEDPSSSRYLKCVAYKMKILKDYCLGSKEYKINNTNGWLLEQVYYVLLKYNKEMSREFFLSARKRDHVQGM